jgi:hypothetical protein
MKLNDNFIIRAVGGVTVLLPVECDSEAQHVVACYNKTAVFIAECLQEETTEEAIIAALTERYEGKREDMALGVSQFLNTLRAAGALVEQPEAEA